MRAEFIPLTMTPAEAAKYLGIGTTKTWKLLKAGRIKAKMLDGRYRIAVADLNAFLEALPDAPIARPASGTRPNRRSGNARSAAS